MRIFFMQLLLPIATYFIGVIVGVLIILKKDRKSKRIEDDCIQHVGYTMEQCGYDK